MFGCLDMNTAGLEWIIETGGGMEWDQDSISPFIR